MNKECFFLTIGNGRVDAVVKSSDGKSAYAVLINAAGELCSCPARVKECRHLRETKALIGKRMLQELVFNDLVKRQTKIKSSLGHFQEMWGGIPTRQLFGWYGAHKAGKTLLMAQLQYDVIIDAIARDKGKGNINVLGIVTEPGLADHFLIGTKEQPGWVPKWNERFDIDVGVESYQIDMRAWVKNRPKTPPLKKLASTVTKDSVAKFVTIEVNGMEQFFLIHGRPSNIDYGKEASGKSMGGKISVIPKGNWKTQYPYIWDTPVAKWVEKFQACSIFYDSFTQPFTSDFSNITQAFPGRSSAMMINLAQITSLCNEYNLVGMASNHLTISPDKPGGKGEPTGGKPIGHNLKYVGYLKRFGGWCSNCNGKNVRVMETRRHPTKDESHATTLLITDDGFVDIVPEAKRKNR